MTAQDEEEKDVAKYFDVDDYATDLEAVADGLFAIASAIKQLADAVDTGGPIALAIHDGFETLGMSISGSMDAVAASIDRE